jgi:hypothetical protein
MLNIKKGLKKVMGFFLERGDTVVHNTKPAEKFIAKLVGNETMLFRKNGKIDKNNPVHFKDFDFKGFTIQKKRGRKFKKK